MSSCSPRDFKYSHEKTKCRSQEPSTFSHSLDGFLQFESGGDHNYSSPITLQTRWVQQLGSHVNNDFLFIGERGSVITKNYVPQNKIAFSEILSLDFSRFSSQIKYTNINSIIGITNLFRIKKKIAVGFEFIVSPTLFTILGSSGIRYRTKDKEITSWLSNCGTLTTCYTSKLTKGFEAASKLELNLYSRESNCYLGLQLNTDKIWALVKKFKHFQKRSTNDQLSVSSPRSSKENHLDEIDNQKDNYTLDQKSKIFDQNYGYLPLKEKNLLNLSFDMKKNWSLLLSHHFSKKISAIISISNKKTLEWYKPEFGIQFNCIN